MKAILAIDLKDDVVSSLATGLRERQSDARLQRASLARATEAVRREVFDLVVIDRSEHPASPAALVAALGETSPATRVVVLGAVDRQERGLFASLGNVEIVARPIEVAELTARIATALQRGVKGHLENVGLAAFVQLLALEKETCTLNVRSGEGTGILFFVRGELFDAELGERSGEESAIEILGWEITDVEMTGSCLRSRRLIQTPLTFLLMEAMRRRDERGRADNGAAHAGGPAGGVPAPPANGAAAATPGVFIPALAHEVEGFIAGALVELATGAVVEAVTTRPDLDPNLAGAFFCELLRQELAMLGALGSRSALEDVVLTFGDEIHVIKLGASGSFLYLVVDRGATSYAALRGVLQAHWHSFETRAKAAAQRPRRDRVTREWEWKI